MLSGILSVTGLFKCKVYLFLNDSKESNIIAHCIAKQKSLWPEFELMVMV